MKWKSSSREDEQDSISKKNSNALKNFKREGEMNNQKPSKRTLVWMKSPNEIQTERMMRLTEKATSIEREKEEKRE